MKVGFLISAGVHLAIFGTMLALSWNTTYFRQSGRTISASSSRQVSLISGSEVAGRQRKLISNKEKPPKNAVPVEEEKTPKKGLERQGDKSSGSGGSGKTPSSGGISTGMTTDASFPHGYYLELIEKKIEAMFSPLAKTPGLVTEIHFVLERGGRATDVKIKKSSGNALFDQAAMRAIMSANPLPPLPGDFGSSSLGILYIFRVE